MKDIFSETNHYELTKKNKPEKNHSEKNKTNTQTNKIYFDENNIEIKYKNHRIETLKVLIMFDYSVFESTRLSTNEIKIYLETILPINYER